MSNFKILKNKNQFFFWTQEHQIGPKDSGSQNFSFLGFEEKAVDVLKIHANDHGGNGMAPDRRIVFSPKHVIYSSKVLGFLEHIF
jgi:hypothetical protein